MQLSLKNCKNIDNGTILIEKGKLNIKYAINGTGKSSIAQAIETKIKDSNWSDIIPYKYLQDTTSNPEHQPIIELDEEISKVSIFNEKYVETYVFQATDLLANSFEIFVKTPDYDAQMEIIKNLILNIHNTFNDNNDLDAFINDLSLFINGFGKAQNGYSKTGAIGKGMARGNKIKNIPDGLMEYKPFIQSSKTAKWLTWQCGGSEFLEFANQCPFCASTLSQRSLQTIQKVATEYNSKYISELQKMLVVCQELNEYFTDDTKKKITQLLNSSTEFTGEQINYLKAIKEEVQTLYNKLITIKNFKFATLKDVDAVINTLNQNKIDISFLPHLNSPHTCSYVELINEALNKVIEKAGELQGAIAHNKRIIANTIKTNKTQINGFLDSAGYKYCVDIVENQNESYRMVLKCKDVEQTIDKVKDRLSYGERNAFALVLFMYETIKENPDLIILDDPISSFDKNKKYAIISRLFFGQQSLKGKTVLMLTHDFDPIVDIIHTTSIRCKFQPVPVASFVYNNNGTLIELPIQPHDIKSFFEIANYKIANAPDEINKLIYLRRLYEACGEKHLGWQLLSNVFHPNREAPIFQSSTENREMTEDEIIAGTSIISGKITNFDYSRIYSRAHDVRQMITLYHSTSSNYEKIQIYRLINHGNIDDPIFKKFVDETYHIENDSLFQLDPAIYPTIPNYIIELCDNDIKIKETQLSN